MPTFAIRHFAHAADARIYRDVPGGLLLTIGAPVFGHLSDRVGRIAVMAAVCVLFALTAYPAFALLIGRPDADRNRSDGGLAESTQGREQRDAAVAFGGDFPDANPRQRNSDQLQHSVPIFGGFAPLISAWLIAVTRSSLAPSIYLIFGSLLSLVVLIAIRVS